MTPGAGRVLASLAVKSTFLTHPIVLAALALLPALAATAVHAAPTPDLGDDGAYQVYVAEKALGREYFSFEPHGDSMFVFSHVRQAIGAAGDSLKKEMAIKTDFPDYDLRGYESNQNFRGQNIKRRLDLGDTVFVSYKEVNDYGTAETLVRPPGRLYVIDPQLFVLFDVLGRSLHKQSFQTRPLVFVVLGDPDTTIEATATDLGVEEIRWGARPVQARKYRLADASSEFLLWTSPEGRMLRLTQPANQLRVEREVKVRGAARRRPRAG